jgi:hypothetical protein
MEIHLEGNDEPLNVVVEMGSKRIKIIIAPAQLDDVVDIAFFKTSVDMLQMEVASPTVRIPVYQS